MSAWSCPQRKTMPHLRLPGLPHEKALATIVYLLEATMMRVGNEEYARQNKSFGLTTLRDRHVRVDGGEVEFRFRGKSGVQHAVRVDDPRLARIVRRMRDLPGQELFQYVDDDGQQRTVGSEEAAVVALQQERLRRAAPERKMARTKRAR